MPKFHFANDAARGRVVVVDLSHIRKGCSVVLPVESLSGLDTPPSPRANAEGARTRSYGTRPGRNPRR